MKRLGVNIDHVATLRNARGEYHPDPFVAAKFVKKHGANSITIHLREDRRHIKDLDAKKICSIKMLLVNLEVSTRTENRKEVTTEGGLNLSKNKDKIKKIVSLFKKKKNRTSLFINPSLKDIITSKDIGTDCVEIHTGKFSNLVKSKKNIKNELIRIKKSSKLAHKLGMEVHAGHGLDYRSTKILSKIDEIQEFNIGHFIIGESIFYGLDKIIKNFKKILR